MRYCDGMTDTTTDTRNNVLHFGYLDDAANLDRTVVEVILTAARCLEIHGYSTDDLLAAYDEGDSFREWGEARHDADYAVETWGRNDSYHGMVFLSHNVGPEMARTLFDHLVDEGIADPTADCSPSQWENTAAWAYTDAEDFSVQHTHGN
jgi:hypothetical protein